MGIKINSWHSNWVSDNILIKNTLIMKTKTFTLALFAFTNVFFAQDRTTVNATSSDVSDNLDLRAVASVFGESRNLEDFERKLNDPKLQLSNLDLNNDNQVDYLRVIESVEGRTHLIVIQAVLSQNVYQDVATVEVEKDKYNKVQVQVVGDVYMYGRNYIYEPVYVNTPVFYDYFWANSYRPYCSLWNWDYYPSYYYAWNPFPLFRYRHNIGFCINLNFQYNYVNYRRCQNAYSNYYSNRNNGYGYERQNPNRSFEQRNRNVSNRYELDQTRPRTRDVAYNNTRTGSTGGESPRENGSTRNESPRGNGSTRSESPRANSDYGNGSTRSESPRGNGSTRSDFPRGNSDYGNGSTRSESPRENGSTRSDFPRANSDYGNGGSTRSESPRGNGSTRSDFPRGNSDYGNGGSTRSESPRGNGSGGGSSRSESPRGGSENRGSRR